MLMLAAALVLFFLNGKVIAQSGGKPASFENPTQVVIVQNPNALETFLPQPKVVQSMVQQGIASVTGKANIKDAWGSLLDTNDVVGLKIYTGPGPVAGTRPAVVRAVIKSLLETGFPAAQVILWDKNFVDLRLPEYGDLEEEFGITVAGGADTGYDPEVFYDSELIGQLVYGDLEFGRQGEDVGRNSHVTKLLTDRITCIISIAPLLNHNEAGVAGHLLSLAMGSVDNTLRFRNNASRLATAVPEIVAMPEIGDRVALCITDALIAQYQGGERGRLHYSAQLNELRFSKDPVALDVLSLRTLAELREKARAGGGMLNMELYRNASLLQIGRSDLNRIRIDKTSDQGTPASVETN